MIERLNKKCEEYIDKVCVQYFPLLLSTLICVVVLLCMVYFIVAIYTGLTQVN